MKENIILVGLSTSGKSTLGKELSKKLNMNFIDCDGLIQQKQGKTISEIFKIYGEPYFRQLEKELIRSFFYLSETVISTGGGMPVYNNNMNALKSIGKVIFLDTPMETLIQRSLIVNDRPLLIEDTKEKILKLYDERIHIYNTADYILNTYNLSINQCVEKLIELIKDK